MPSEPELIDAWLAAESFYTLYDEPVASDGEFFDYWHTPAVKQGLPVLAKVYKHGFDGEDVATLLPLGAELELLESHWHSLNLPADQMERLQERMGFLCEAIRLALERNGSLSIT